MVEKAKRALTYAGFDLAGDANALSDEEVEFYIPQVAQFFQRVGIAIDYAVTHTNRAHSESDIWLFEDSEAETLARIYLKRARRIGWMAQVARQVHHIEDVGEAKDVATILGKRLVATGLFYGSNGGLGLWLQ